MASVSTLTYGEGPDEAGDLWVPHRSGRPAVVVLIHGGFWRERYRRDLMDPLARDLAHRGFAVWNLEYRRVGGSGGWPHTLDDVARGIDHLSTLDADIDLERTATLGHSAGGQLALWALGRRRPVSDEPRVRPRTAVCLSGVADLVSAAREGVGSGAVQAFVGGEPDELPDRYAAASPTALAPFGVPHLLVHPPSDDVVPVSQSRSYAAAAGDEARLEEPDGDHFSVIDPGAESWEITAGWLSEHL